MQAEGGRSAEGFVGSVELVGVSGGERGRSRQRTMRTRGAWARETYSSRVWMAAGREAAFARSRVAVAAAAAAATAAPGGGEVGRSQSPASRAAELFRLGRAASWLMGWWAPAVRGCSQPLLPGPNQGLSTPARAITRLRILLYSIAADGSGGKQRPMQRPRFPRSAAAAFHPRSCSLSALTRLCAIAAAWLLVLHRVLQQRCWKKGGWYIWTSGCRLCSCAAAHGSTAISPNPPLPTPDRPIPCSPIHYHSRPHRHYCHARPSDGPDGPDGPPNVMYGSFGLPAPRLASSLRKHRRRRPHVVSPSPPLIGRAFLRLASASTHSTLSFHPEPPPRTLSLSVALSPCTESHTEHAFCEPCALPSCALFSVRCPNL